MRPSIVKLITQLSACSGLGHDLGKYGSYFQHKLDISTPIKDPVRHEWISLSILMALRNSSNWSEAWEAPLPVLKKSVLSRELQSGLDALDYIVATHHRLPAEKEASGVLDNKTYISDSTALRKPVGEPNAKMIAAILTLSHSLNKNYDAELLRAIATVSRACVILADHSVSGIDATTEPNCGKETTIHANTNSVDGNRQRNQGLQWHLNKVSESAAHIAQSLFDYQPAGLSKATIDRIEKSDQPTPPRFQWQDKAANAVKDSDVSTLIYNMAGTGAGKTRANIRLISALSGNKPVRIAVGLNLRTLTLQTKDAFQYELGMRPNELTCIIGSRTVTQLHESNSDEDNDPQVDTDFTLDPRDIATDFPDWLTPFIEKRDHLQPLITAPVAVCTIDYLVAAGEPSKQANHALAMMRVMNSDLILDEIDSYDPTSLCAVLRLITTAAMFGRHVVVSSATLSVEVAKAVYEAFECGAKMYSKLNDSKCPWRYAYVDNLNDPEVFSATDLHDFGNHYESRTHKLVNSIEQGHRPAELQRVDDISTSGWRKSVIAAIKRMHQRHCLEIEGINVSVGLVRCANINPAVALARSISEEVEQSKVCCYHGNHTLIQRYHIESSLDKLLRRNHSCDVWKEKIKVLPEFVLAKQKGDIDLLLIVVASPVEEIGRDHDFDYAVIEPSSAQSIVQTAGRVNRHRLCRPEHPNVCVMQYAYRYCDKKSGPIFTRPGLEIGQKYNDYDLATLLDWDSITQIDAQVRFGNHPFAMLDDRSLSRLLKKPLRRITGKYKWMSEYTYSNWPLRDHDKQDSWVIDENGVYYVVEYLGRNKTQKTDKKVAQVPRVTNDWLVLDLNEQIDLCRTKDIALDEGMGVSLHRHTGAKRPTHDLSFGFALKQHRRH